MRPGSNLHIICVCIYTSIQLEYGTRHQLKQLVILLHQVDRLGLSHSWLGIWHKLCVSAPVHSTRYHLKATVIAWHIYITPYSVENRKMLGSYLVWIMDTFEISNCFIWWKPAWKHYSWSNVFNEISMFHDFFIIKTYLTRMTHQPWAVLHVVLPYTTIQLIYMTTKTST